MIAALSAAVAAVAAYWAGRVRVGRRALERAVEDVAAFTALLAEAGVRVVVATAPEPVYDRSMLARVHRRHSLPTAGYDGS